MRLSGRPSRNSLNTNPVPQNSNLSGVGDSSETFLPNVVPAGSSLSLANKLAGIETPGSGGVSVHSDLQGLSANDHPQYLLSSLASSITGGVSVHSDLAGLSSDDHPQYQLSSGMSDYAASNHTHDGTYLGTTYTSHTHGYLNTSQSSLFQQTSNTSGITSNALNTSISSVFRHTSADSLIQFTSNTSNITSNALHTSQSSLLQHTSATSAITVNALNTSQSSLFRHTSQN